MSRRDVRCLMQHTPASPGKNRVRRDWLATIDPKLDILTISHGLLESLMMARWQGRIWVCDIDPGVIESTEYQRQDYPELDIAPPLHGRVEDIASLLVWKIGRQLGAIDLDLTGCIHQVWPILQDVLSAVRQHKVSPAILLTFRNGRRDGFRSLDARMQWLSDQLCSNGMRRVKIVEHVPYASGRIREDASRKKGSAMCMVRLAA